MLTDLELSEQPFPDTFDNTMRTTACQCKRKFYWFLRGYDYASRPAYFTWGSAWHEILRTWYSGPEIDPQDLELFTQAKERAIRAGLDFWDSEGGFESGVNKRATLRTIFEAYIDQYPTVQWSMVADGDERGWIWPVKGTPYFLAGSIDLYVQWPGYGFLALENKTAGSYLSDSYISQWDFSTQISGYSWYMDQLHGDDAFGVLVNMATKNVPGPRSKWTTARFQHSLQARTQFQLEEFIGDFLWDIESLKKSWDRWYFPKTSDVANCAGGTGKAPCLFKPVCLLDLPFTKVDPLQFQGIAPREEEWKPWERKGEQS